MNAPVLIIGYGSIGKKHAKILMGKPRHVCNYRFALDTMKLIDKIKSVK